MDMFEEAKALDVTMKMRKMSQTEAAKMLGVSQSYIANKLRLLHIDEAMRVQITAHRLSERHARALLRVEDREQRWQILDRVCNERLSVARTEALVDLIHSSEAPKRIGRADRLNAISTFTDSLKDSATALRALGVEINHSQKYYGSKLYITLCINEE